PHLTVTYQEAIVYITVSPHRYFKIKLLIRRVRLVGPHVIVDPRSPKDGAAPAIAQRRLRIDSRHTGSPLNKNPIALKQGLKLFCKLPDLRKCRLIEIPFKSAYTADIGRQASPADLFKDLVNKLPFYHHGDEPGKCAGIYPQNTVTDNMVRYAR